MRVQDRSNVSQVVWVVPCDSQANADYARAFPAVTKDLSPLGIAFFHNACVTESHAIVGLNDGTGDRRFFLCTVKHCTPLEHGFHQIGLSVAKKIAIGPAEKAILRQAIEAGCRTNQPQPAALVPVVG